MDRDSGSADTFPLRRLADVAASAGAGGLIALLLASHPFNSAAGWASAALLVVGLLSIVVEHIRVSRLDAHAWTTDQWETLRNREYGRRGGVFLVHKATRTDAPPDSEHQDKEWWSVTLELRQHRTGPLSERQIKEVEYYFGDKFTEGPVKVQQPANSFPYRTDIYGSLLVVGRVHFKNRLKRPLLVYRYVDLPPVS